MTAPPETRDLPQSHNNSVHSESSGRTPSEMHPVLHPVFLYGTLMSSRLLAGLLTGDERHWNTVEKRRKKATLHGYSRHAVLDADYPAVVKAGSADSVEGFLYYPRKWDDIGLLDHFESNSYYRAEVEVVDSESHATTAYIYVWCDELEDLAEEDWSFEEFEAKWLC